MEGDFAHIKDALPTQKLSLSGMFGVAIAKGLIAAIDKDETEGGLVVSL